MAKRKERKLGQGLSAGTHFEWNRRISTKIHNPKKNTSTKKYYDGSSQRKTP